MWTRRPEQIQLLYNRTMALTVLTGEGGDSWRDYVHKSFDHRARKQGKDKAHTLLFKTPSRDRAQAN